MSLVTFLGIYFVREAGISLATVGLAFLVENLLRGLAAPFFGALSDRVGRRPLLLAASSAAGYLLVAALYAFGLRGPLPMEVSQREPVMRAALSASRDRVFLGFAAVAFVFPFSMGLVVTASPLFAAQSGLGEGFIGLVLGLKDRKSVV